MSKQTTTLILIAIVFLVLGYGSSLIIPLREWAVFTSGENTFQAGWEAAEKRLAESGFAPMLGEGIEIKAVNGNIQKIEGRKITLKIQPLNPLADPELDIRVVDIGQAEVYQLVQKDTEEFQKEMSSFNDRLQRQLDEPEKLPEPITPPEMFIKKKISSDKLQVGQQITVTTEEDIKEAKQITASEIDIQFMPSLNIEETEGL